MNMKRLGAIFGEIDVILRGLSRGLDLSVIDKGHGEQGGAPVSFSALSDSLAVILVGVQPIQKTVRTDSQYTYFMGASRAKQLLGIVELDRD